MADLWASCVAGAAVGLAAIPLLVNLLSVVVLGVAFAAYVVAVFATATTRSLSWVGWLWVSAGRNRNRG